MVQHTHKQLNLPTTVVALVNGMIGGSILVIPLTSMQAGWAFTIIVIAVTGLFSFYSCYLAVIHLGDQKDLDSALLRHFNGSKFLKIFYDFCVWIGMVLILMLYFDLIVLQWQGLVPPYDLTLANAFINAAFLLIWCIVLKFFDFGAHIMGYGIASIVGYLIFLIWVLSTRPSGPATIPAFGTGIAGFAAMMGSAFSIQGFFIPVLKGYKKEGKHIWILFMAYVIGTGAYYYIAYMGSFGILNRQNYQNLNTIEEFFTNSQWQVKLLEAIYLVHLYSVFPEYMIVCKKRFFSMFGIKQTGRKSVSVVEVIYIIIIIGICLVFTIFQISIDIIIDINGAVLGFCFIYFLPSILHIKCTYFPKGKRQMELKQDIFGIDEQSTKRDSEITQIVKDQTAGQVIESQERQQVLIELQESTTRKFTQILEKQMVQGQVRETEQKQQVDQNMLESNVQEIIPKDQRTLTVKLEDGSLKTQFIEADGQQTQFIEQDYSYYYCAYVKPSLKRQIVEMTLLVIMFLFGVFTMVDGLIQVVQTIQG